MKKIVGDKISINKLSVGKVLRYRSVYDLTI